MFKFEVLKHKDFKNLWLAQVSSQFGDAFYMWVLLYMVDKITQSPVTVSYMGVVEMLPFLLFSPYAGVMADRIDRKKIMYLADRLSVLVLALFGLSICALGIPPLWLIFGAGFCLSTINSFFTPAKSAAIPTLVPEKDLQQANALSTATQSMMPILGIALSGSMLVAIEKLMPKAFFPSAVFLNALTFAGSAYFVRKLPKLQVDKAGSEPEKHPIKECTTGITYVVKHPVLRIIFIDCLISHLASTPYLTAYITANRLWFGGEFSTLAIMEGMQGLAMVIGSLWIGKLAFKKLRTPYFLGSTFIALFIFAMSLSQTFLWFTLFNAIAGLMIPFIEVPTTTYIQANVPNHYLGRVNSLHFMISMGIMPFGMIFAGHFVNQLGPSLVFLGMGVLFALCGLIGLSSRAFRNANLPHQEQRINRETKPEVREKVKA